MRKARAVAGQVLVGVLILSICLVILVTAMVYWVQQESRTSVKHKKSTAAFHLAEAAVDRGRWKLQETGTYWTITSTGGVISGYNFDKAYADVAGGKYAIKISSDPTNSERRIIEGAGRDDSTAEVRRIRAVFERQNLDSAIWSGGEVDLDGNSEVHWGPIRAQEEIDLDNQAANLRFPRLYSRLEIDPEPPYCSDTDCANKTDNIQYWAFTDVPPRPIIDFEALKSSAISNGTYFTDDQTWTNAYPGGACGGCPAGVSSKLDQNLIWYFEEELELKSQKYLYGTVIVMKELEMEGGGKGTYTTTPPGDAYMEYKKINGGVGDTAAESEYYADAGLATVSASFAFTDSGPTPAKKDGIKKAVSIRGLIYGKEEFEAKGENVIHGIILIDKDEVENSGTTVVFFDRNANKNLTILNAVLNLKEWKEVPGTWPSGL
jgi:hypothetical protein